MKRKRLHKIYALLLVLVLLFPIGVNFGHSFAEHDDFRCHAESIKHLHQHKDSCAVFHYIQNYNTPLVSNIFTFKTYNVFDNQFIFKPLKHFKTACIENALRAPPIC